MVRLNADDPMRAAAMTFVVLEGFSGTGKTSLAKGLEERGWLRLEESAHAVPKSVPLADRADTYADFSLLGSTMVYASLIAQRRGSRRIVSEGYLLSDLAYAKIRQELKKSTAYPAMLETCRGMLSDERLRPDLYVVLQARRETIETRQRGKEDREKNETDFFRDRYYSALSEIHKELHEEKVAPLYTNTDMRITLEALEAVLRGYGISVK